MNQKTDKSPPSGAPTSDNTDTATRKVKNTKRTNILVCLDGSEEAYMGLRYATKLTMDRTDTDVTLLFLRPHTSPHWIDPKQQELDDQEIVGNKDETGLAILKKGRNMLIERGFLKQEWEDYSYDRMTRGAETINHSVRYTSKKTGQTLTLHVRDAKQMASGIIDEAHFYEYDFLILSPSTHPEEHAYYIDETTAINIAIEHDGTVILVREMEEGHGHFVYISSDPSAIDLAVKDAEIAVRCGCPVYLYAVAPSQEELKNAEERVEKAKKAVEDRGYKVSSTQVDIGEPVWRITENGRKHSLIVISDQEKKSFFKQFFQGNQAHDILRKARNSVMIIR